MCCSISILPPLVVKKPRTSCDCPSTVFVIKENNSDQIKERIYKGNKTLYLTNTMSLTLKPKEIKTIYFCSSITTSLPAICIMFGSEFLYKQGISYKINHVRSNDVYPHINICNHTTKTIQIAQKQLTFMCTIILL